MYCKLHKTYAFVEKFKISHVTILGFRAFRQEEKKVYSRSMKFYRLTSKTETGSLKKRALWHALN
jgi:hypothetical protein